MFLRLKSWIFPLLIILIALWSVWLVVEFPTKALFSGGDDLLQVWIINQNIQKIPSNLLNIFEGNIYYPYKNVIAYSDIFLPSTLLAYLPVQLTGQPILAWNTTFIFGQFATMLVVYFWFTEMTKSRWAAFLGAVVLSLSQIRFHYSPHLQMWTMQWWLISVWMLWRFTKNGKAWQLYVAGLFAAIQFWESPLPLYWIVMFAIVLLVSKISLLRKNLKHLILSTAIAAVLIFPAANAYFGVSREFDYKRPIRDAAHFSLSLEETWGKFWSPGLYVLTVAAFLSLEKKQKNRNRDLKWLIPVLVISFVMAMGPVVKWQQKTFKILDIPIPLPYATAYYLVPGFGGLRTPSRWLWPAALTASAVVALGFTQFDSKKRRLIFVPALLLAIIGGTKINDVVELPIPDQYPAVYKFLKKQPGDVIIELPIYTWGTDKNNIEVRRMLYSLEHKKKLVNGYSGFTPPDWLDFAEDMAVNFPNEELERELNKIEVDYVLVHKDEYEAEKVQEISNWGEDRLIWEDSKTEVYEL